MAAATQLRAFGKEPDVLGAFIAALKQELNSDVRKEVVRVLGELKDPSVIEPLTATLEADFNSDVRLAAAEALR